MYLNYTPCITESDINSHLTYVTSILFFFRGRGVKSGIMTDFLFFSLFYCRKTCSRDKKDEDDDDKKNKHESKLDAKFFSFTTFYYLVNQKIKEKTKPTTFFFPTLRHLYCFFSFVVSC